MFYVLLTVLCMVCIQKTFIDILNISRYLDNQWSFIPFTQGLRAIPFETRREKPHESAPWISECSCDMNMYMWNMQITYNYMSTIPNITIYDRTIWNSLQSCTLPKTLLMLSSDSPHWYRGYLHQMLWNQYIVSPSGNFWQKKWQTSQTWWNMHRKCQLFRYLNIHFECTNMRPIWPSMQTSCRRVEEVLVG